MKKVLIISYYWPPTGGSGVQRWVKFCKYLPSQGWLPIVYTPENPEQLVRDESLLKDIPSEVEVVKTRIFEPYGIYRKLSGKKSVANAEVNPLNAQKKSFGQKLAVWIRGNLFIPDPRVMWLKPSVKFLVKYLQEHPVDIIVTTGPPQSMHLIGRNVMRALRRKGNNTLRWIVDFRDPWTQMYYFKHTGLTTLSTKIHRHQEQSVIDECDMIVAVSPPVQDDFKKMTATPVELVTNGFDEDDYTEAAQAPEGLDGKFVIAHTGLFASDGNPLRLWQALSDLCSSDTQFREKLRLVLAGKTDKTIIEAIHSARLEPNLVNLGYLPHIQTVALQKRADMLILPLRQEPEYAKALPGKIFEYLASRRPVLGIGQGDGAAAKVLTDSGSGVMYDWECREEFYTFVRKVWDEFKCGVNNSVKGGTDDYSRRKLTSRMVSLFEKVLQMK